MYTAGKNTKDKIYTASKKLFYDKGFSYTTCSDIAKSAEVGLASVNYYYKSKADLGIIVLDDYSRDVTQCVARKIGELGKAPTPLVVALVEFGMNIRLITTNKNVGRFWRQVKMEDSAYTSRYSTVRVFAERDFAEVRDIHSFRDRTIIEVALAGAVDKVYAAYVDKYLSIGNEELTEKMMMIILRMLTVDQEIATRLIRESIELLDAMTLDVGDAFEVS